MLLVTTLTLPVVRAQLEPEMVSKVVRPGPAPAPCRVVVPVMKTVTAAPILTVKVRAVPADGFIFQLPLIATAPEPIVYILPVVMVGEKVRLLNASAPVKVPDVTVTAASGLIVTVDVPATKSPLAFKVNKVLVVDVKVIVLEPAVRLPLAAILSLPVERALEVLVSSLPVAGPAPEP